MGTQLADKTLGIVGLGRIGQAVAKRAKAFEMRVLGYDPFLSTERAEELGIEPVASVADMLPQVDYLTVHTPLTDETRNLIDRSAIESLEARRAADQLRPRRHLRRGGAGRGAQERQASPAWRSTCSPTEPCTDSPLFGMPGVLCTPHLGASTEEAQTQVAVEGVGLLVDFLTTGAIRHAVNMSAARRQDARRVCAAISTWLSAGPAAGAVRPRRAKTLRAALSRRSGRQEHQAAHRRFAAGLLENALGRRDQHRQRRGAAARARHRAGRAARAATWAPSARRSPPKSITDQATHRAAGTLFGHDMPRLVQLDDIGSKPTSTAC